MIEQVTVLFDILNPRGFPLVIPDGQLNFMLGPSTTKYFMRAGNRLTPKIPHTVRIEFNLNEGQADQFLNSELMVTVRGASILLMRWAITNLSSLTDYFSAEEMKLGSNPR